MTAIDAKGRILIFNQEAERLTGGFQDVGPEFWQQAYGVFEADETTPLETSSMPILRALKGETVRDADLFLRNPAHPGGIHVRVTATPMREGADGAISGAVAVFFDITEHRRSAHFLRQVERLSMLGKMAGAIAHELNNPLAAVLASTEAARNVQKSDPGSELIEDCLKNVMRSAQRCSDIVHNVLAFSREEAPVRSPADPNAIISKAADRVARLATERNSVLSVEKLESPPDFHAHALQIEQAIINLARNAIFSKPEGVVVKIGAEATEETMRFYVRDTGPGMAAQVVEHAFDPFFTTRHGDGGSGLGLGIVKAIVESHGGHVRIETKLGEGSTVWIELPLAAPASPTLDKSGKNA